MGREAVEIRRERSWDHSSPPSLTGYANWKQQGGVILRECWEQCQKQGRETLPG